MRRRDSTSGAFVARWWGSLAGALFLALGLGLAVAPAADAHAALRSSNPADGSVVTTPPPRFELVFNEEVDANFAQVVIEDAGGTARTQTDLAVRGPSVSGAFPRDLPAGATRLRYRIVSADGHPVAGEISFEIKGAPSASAPSTPAATSGAAVPAAPPTTTAAGAQAVAQDTERGVAVGNVVMFVLGGIGVAAFVLVAALLVRADRRRR